MDADDGMISPPPPARSWCTKLSITQVRREKRLRNRATYNASVIKKVRREVNELKVREDRYKEEARVDHELNMKMQGEMVALSERAGQLNDLLKVRTQRFTGSTDKTKRKHSMYKKQARDRDSLIELKGEGKKLVAFAEAEGTKRVEEVARAGQLQLDNLKSDAQMAINKEKKNVLKQKKRADGVKGGLYEVRKTI